LGHENAVTLLQYSPPLLTDVFPARFGDSHTGNYQAHGMYSSSIPFETAGNIRLKADALGMLVLPSGDTLRQVIRTKSIRSISETLPTLTGDSVTVNTSVENYKWYSKGYRYPVFETIRNIVYRDSTETNRFETAFFYPPQEHFYLDDDEENRAIQEEDENVESDPWAGLSYNIFPNPVQYTPLELELYLPRSATVRVQLRSTMGLIALDENKGTYPVGICNFQFNVSSLPIGNYVLDIWLNDHLINEIIMKR
jgi:hypothetical protein